MGCLTIDVRNVRVTNPKSLHQNGVERVPLERQVRIPNVRDTDPSTPGLQCALCVQSFCDIKGQPLIILSEALSDIYSRYT